MKTRSAWSHDISGRNELRAVVISSGVPEHARSTGDEIGTGAHLNQRARETAGAAIWHGALSYDDLCNRFAGVADITVLLWRANLIIDRNMPAVQSYDKRETRLWLQSVPKLRHGYL